MHKNSSLFETHYLRSERGFISECRKRNLHFDTKLLSECQKHALLLPVLEINGEAQYDTFQISLVAKILNKVSKLSDIEEKLEDIKTSTAGIERVLPLLYQVRYFYQEDIYSFRSSGILPPFKMNREQAVAFSSNFAEFFYDALKKYKPKQYLKGLGLDKKEFVEIRNSLFISGHNIDPMAKWYPFIRTIRLADDGKFKLIEKEVLLAHDFYILAELLTLFYRDAIGQDILDPEDIFDGRGGKWRLKDCEECGQEMRAKNAREKYCLSCKRKIAEREGVTSKCSKCSKPFYKYVDGDEMVNKPFKSNRKKVGGSDTVTKVKLHYGRVVIYTMCECGTLNYEVIEKGWF